ncbi:MAG: hypothetical protein AB8D78_08160, partial [Akkermansiaceae bacterium]
MGREENEEKKPVHPEDEPSKGDFFAQILAKFPRPERFRTTEKRSSLQVAALIDSLAAFATLDDVLSPVEADLILDMLRSAFPEVDHGWLTRRLRRAVKNPKPLQGLSADLRETLNEAEKIEVGLQLYTLVDASGRSDRSRASFEVFMRRLGRPAVGAAIMREMRADEEDVAEADLPFERLIFGGKDPDIELPPAAGLQQFRVYRTGDLILLRNTGPNPLWIRGKSLPVGGFLRVRDRQVISVSGWTLSNEDLGFFLDVRKMGNRPALYLADGDEGLIAERTRTRASEVCVRFGLDAEVEVLAKTYLHVGSRGHLKKGETFHCRNHERIGGPAGFSLTVNDLRKRVLQSGRRFRLAQEQQEYLVSNAPSALRSGGLLITAVLAPRAGLFIRSDSDST